jgi:hypothetical protein
MMVDSADIPEAARRAVLRDMGRRAADRGFWTPKLQCANPDALHLCLPHRVAVLRLDKIRADANLHEIALMVGWRFIISESTNLKDAIAAAHAIIDKDGEYRLSELNEGPFVKATVSAIHHARENPLRETSESLSPDPWLLIAPAVFFAGLWLRHQQADKDRIFEMQAVPPLVVERFTPSELLNKLAKLAEKVPVEG